MAHKSQEGIYLLILKIYILDSNRYKDNWLNILTIMCFYVRIKSYVNPFWIGYWDYFESFV